MKEIHVGVDTGGTFTDFVVWLRDTVGSLPGQVYSFKILSTPDDPSRAIIAGLERILKNHGSGKNTFTPADLHLTHGSTVATNAVLEGKGGRTAFVATKGFKDILHLARQNRPNLYDLSARRPPGLLGPADTFEVLERTGSRGEVLTALDKNSLEDLGRAVAAGGLRFGGGLPALFFLNPQHEQKVAEVLRSLPQSPAVSISSQVLPEFREYERAATTFINAYVSPVMRKYLERLSRFIGHDNWAVFGSAGGGIRVDHARNEAVRTVLSGPAGGVTAAYYLGRRLGRTKLLTFDMGGTSTDVALINDSIPFTTEGNVRDLPVGLPMISIHTVGAGGGSLGRLDDGGALQTGPESAGADPGPVCYGNGGMEPAVSDANLILGRLPRSQPLADGSRLDFAAAEQALTDLGTRAGLAGGDSAGNSAPNGGLSPAETAALGMIRIADTHMENALRHISLERGHDPRDFTLVSFGGAGGLHAAELAHRLGIPEVWIPAQASTFSALGMLCADFVRDFSVTVMLTSPAADDLEGRFSALHESAAGQIAGEIGEEQLASGHWMRTVDVRYLGQSFEIRTGYSTDYAAEFSTKHKMLYGYTQYSPLQVVNIRLRFTLERPKPDFGEPAAATSSKTPTASGAPTALKNETRHEQVQIVCADGRRLSGPLILSGVQPEAQSGQPARPAQTIQAGPALIVRPDTTVYVPPGWTAYQEAENLFLRAE